MNTWWCGWQWFAQKNMQLHSKIFITGLAFKYKAQVQRFFRMVHEKTTNSDFFFFFWVYSSLWWRNFVVKHHLELSQLNLEKSWPLPSHPRIGGRWTQQTLGKVLGSPPCDLWLQGAGYSGHSNLHISHLCWLLALCAGLFLPENKPCGISLSATPWTETVLEQFQPSLVRERTPFRTSILNPG